MPDGQTDDVDGRLVAEALARLFEAYAQERDVSPEQMTDALGEWLDLLAEQESRRSGQRSMPNSDVSAHPRAVRTPAMWRKDPDIDVPGTAGDDIA